MAVRFRPMGLFTMRLMVVRCLVVVLARRAYLAVRGWRRQYYASHRGRNHHHRRWLWHHHNRGGWLSRRYYHRVADVYDYIYTRLCLWLYHHGRYDCAHCYAEDCLIHKKKSLRDSLYMRIDTLNSYLFNKNNNF